MRRCVLLGLFLLIGLMTRRASAQTSTVPYDTLELATGPVDVADTPEKRTAALALLEQARQSLSLHMPGGPPFDLKVSFSSSGTTQYSGAGQMEEMWASMSQMRWTAHVGSYNEARVFTGSAGYDSNPHAYLPLRVQMLREALFGPVPGRFPYATIRTVAATWKGVPVTCVLVSGTRAEPTSGTGRRWQEEEFCIDPKNGLLQTSSVAPGMYTVYDYGGAYQFHGRVIPRQFAVTVAGATALQAQIDALSDLDAKQPNLFAPGDGMGMPAIVIRGPQRFSQVLKSDPQMSSAPASPVIVHAVLSMEGKVLESEALQTSDRTLAEAALAAVNNTQYESTSEPIQREIFVNVMFRPGEPASNTQQ
ncbi:MAG: hypothetical protein JO270_11185 [Acidobacteriaceae bacterium]|nr:hypothetical protein [Acidobacteriaceae bacterium]